jgi:hypothetical protein
MTLFHMIPKQVGLSRDPLCTRFPCTALTNTTVHLISSDVTCCIMASRVQHTCDVCDICDFCHACDIWNFWDVCDICDDCDIWVSVMSKMSVGACDAPEFCICDRQ